MGVQPDQTLPSGRGRKRKQTHATDSLPSSSSASPSASASAAGSSSSARKLPSSSGSSSAAINGGYSYAGALEDEEDAMPNEKAKKIKSDHNGNEKRLRMFRPKAPQAFYDVYERATTQRFFVLSRTRCGTADCPEELVELTGSTGNIYNVCIAQQPSCDCPHGQQGNQCKHWLYVMSRVLRARHDLVYQLALLSTELQEIFSAAPPSLHGSAESTSSSSSSAPSGSKDKNRKPVEGDCPICFEELDANSHTGSEAIVWCRAACGQNIHKQCFQMWSTTKRQQAGGEVTCPFCRSKWEGDADMVWNIEKTGPVNEEGYVNVADQLGISTERDYSTYSRWWSGHPRSYRSYGLYGRHGRY